MRPQRGVIAAGLLLTLAGMTAAQRETEPKPCASVIIPQDATSPDFVLPADPLQRIAYRAVIIEEFGPLPAWKLAAYKRVLQDGITVQGAAKRTNYCPRCSGGRCADGSRVRPGVCAAPKIIPMHSVIWLASDGLLKVCDRGGAVKAWPSRFLRRGEDVVIDVWQRSCGSSCNAGTRRRVPYAVIERGAR